MTDDLNKQFDAALIDKLRREANFASDAGYALTADLLCSAADRIIAQNDEIERLKSDVTDLMAAANEALNP